MDAGTAKGGAGLGDTTLEIGPGIGGRGDPAAPFPAGGWSFWLLAGAPCWPDREGLLDR